MDRVPGPGVGCPWSPVSCPYRHRFVGFIWWMHWLSGSNVHTILCILNSLLSRSLDQVYLFNSSESLDEHKSTARHQASAMNYPGTVRTPRFLLYAVQTLTLKIAMEIPLSWKLAPMASSKTCVCSVHWKSDGDIIHGIIVWGHILIVKGSVWCRSSSK